MAEKPTNRTPQTCQPGAFSAEAGLAVLSEDWGHEVTMAEFAAVMFGGEGKEAENDG